MNTSGCNKDLWIEICATMSVQHFTKRLTFLLWFFCLTHKVFQERWCFTFPFARRGWSFYLLNLAIVFVWAATYRHNERISEKELVSCDRYSTRCPWQWPLSLAVTVANDLGSGTELTARFQIRKLDWLAQTHVIISASAQRVFAPPPLLVNANIWNIVDTTFKNASSKTVQAVAERSIGTNTETHTKPVEKKNTKR